MTKSVAACRGCGAGLTVLQIARGLCDDPECRRKDVAYQEELRRHDTLARVREAMPEAWHADTALAILPRNQQRLVPLGRERIDAHRRYLEQIVQEAAELLDAGVAPAETQATTSGVSKVQANLAVLGAACGLCGGYCCNTGGNTAWLEPDNIVRLFGSTSAVDRNAIVESYLCHLPETSFENSCIYHAEYGCALPKSIRSGVCNQYLCRGLGEVAEAVSSEPYRCVAAAMAGSRIDEMALVDAEGILDRPKPEKTGG